MNISTRFYRWENGDLGQVSSKIRQGHHGSKSYQSGLKMPEARSRRVRQELETQVGTIVASSAASQVLKWPQHPIAIPRSCWLPSRPRLRHQPPDPQASTTARACVPWGRTHLPRAPPVPGPPWALLGYSPTARRRPSPQASP